MPQIKTQKKRVITDAKKNLANSAKKSALRTAMKKVMKAVEANDKEAACVAFNLANESLDKLQSSKIYHRNYVARQKSRLQKAINTLN